MAMLNNQIVIFLELPSLGALGPLMSTMQVMQVSTLRLSGLDNQLPMV